MAHRWSGGFRKGGFNYWRARPKIFGLPRPLSVTEYLEATLGLVKRLEISKELICECVTVPGCCCCMPLLHNHLMDSCSYVRKNTPNTPPKSATAMHHAMFCFYIYEMFYRAAARDVQGVWLPLILMLQSCKFFKVILEAQVTQICSMDILRCSYATLKYYQS